MVEEHRTSDGWPIDPELGGGPADMKLLERAFARGKGHGHSDGSRSWRIEMALLEANDLSFHGALHGAIDRILDLEDRLARLHGEATKGASL